MTEQSTGVMIMFVYKLYPLENLFMKETSLKPAIAARPIRHVLIANTVVLSTKIHG